MARIWQVVAGAALATGCAAEGGAYIASGGELATARIDAYGHVELAEVEWRRPLAIEHARAVPWQEFRILMTDRQRAEFNTICEEVEHGRTDLAPGDALADPRERYLVEHGIRLKYELRQAGLQAGLAAEDAEKIAISVIGSQGIQRHSLDDPRPGYGPQGGLDYSHDLIERVLLQSFNGYGTLTTLLSHRNGKLEWWEVHQTDLRNG